MTKLVSLVAAMALLPTLLPVGAAALPEVVIYNGTPVADQNITLGGWGSGIATESTRTPYNNSHSITVMTDGYYSGARMVFNQPLDLTDAFADPNTYIQFVIQFPGYTPPEDILGLPGAYGYGYGTGTEGIALPATQYFRVTMKVNGVELMVEDHPLDVYKNENGWILVSIPLAAFKGPQPNGQALLSELMLFGDKTDQFILGEIRTVIDEDPIIVEPIDLQSALVNDPTEWVAEAQGGLATIEYVWDFDASDGLQEEAFGPYAQKVYRTTSPPDEGFIVTLRVRDIYGVKPEVQVVTTAEIYPL